MRAEFLPIHPCRFTSHTRVCACLFAESNSLASAQKTEDADVCVHMEYPHLGLNGLHLTALLYRE
jgi:hypothetical protein